MAFIPIFTPPTRGGRDRKPAPPAATVAVIIAGVVGGILLAARTEQAARGGARPGVWVAETIVIAAIILGLALVPIVRRLQRGTEETEAGTPATDRQADLEESRPIRKLMIVGFIVAAAVLLALALLGTTARAQAAGSRGSAAFVITRGADTLVVNRATWTDTTIVSDVVIALRGRLLVTAAVAGDVIPRVSLQVWGPGAPADAMPLQRATMALGPDSVRGTVMNGGRAEPLVRPYAAGTVPMMGNEFALLELAMRRVRAARSDTTVLKTYQVTAATTIPATFIRVGEDTVLVRIAGQEMRLRVDAAGRVLGGAVPAQGLLMSRLEGSAASRVGIGRPDYGPPAGAPYRAEEVTVRTPAGHVLSGTLTLPTGTTGRVPAVVTITGSGQQDRDESIPTVAGYRPMRQVADTLGRRGIAVLRLDDRGINGSGGDPSGTSADFADDVRAGVAFLRARPDIDARRIALVGHSEGGMIAPMVAATDPRLAGIVLLAGPAYDGRRILELQNDTAIAQNAALRTAAQRDSVRRTVAPALDSIARVNPWFGFFMRHDPVATARRVRVPVLILQGATDQQVSPEQAPLLERALREGGNSRVRTVVFPARNHLFLRDPVGNVAGYSRLDGKVDGEVMGTLAEWLVATLRVGR